MSKSYIQIENTQTNVAKVLFCNNKPFDSIFGLGKTEAELLKTGYIVDYVPEENIEGKVSVMMYNKDINTIYYDYVDAVADPKIFTTEQEIEALKAQVDALNIALAQVMGV